MRGDKADVIVVGAGLAGLSTARQLTQEGCSVRVLEARDRVGGRTLTQGIGGGTFDLGGQWIGPMHERMVALAREFGVEIFPTYAEGKKVLDLGGSVTTYKRTIPKLPIRSLIELQLALLRIERMRKRVPPDRPYAARDSRHLDAQSLEQWTRRVLRTKKARSVFDSAIRTVFGVDPAELSLLFFLFYVNSGGGLERLIEIHEGNQQDHFVGGAQQLSIRMAHDLGDRVELGVPVRAIAQGDDLVQVMSDSGTYRAKRAVVAVPPALAGRIRYEPALPAARDHLMQRMSMGSTIKCVALYDRPFWRERGFSGELISDGLVSVVFDDTTHDGAQPALLSFIVGRNAYRWGERPGEERRSAVLWLLARSFGTEALTPTAYVEQNWSDEVWTRGAPIGFMPPGVLTAFGEALRAPVARLHWAGTETATDCCGFMEGALQSGERVAAEVLQEL